jgi:amidophosphoribosyltransferase
MQGVIGVYSREDVGIKSLYTLYGVQHRGQESAGVAAAGDRSLRVWSGAGLVSRVFDERYTPFSHPDDYVVIGCASGESVEGGLPPRVLETGRYKIAVTLDGYIPKKQGESNEEAFLDVLEAKLQGTSIIPAMREAMWSLPTAYFSLVAVVLDKKEKRSTLFAARDPRGVRPLHVARTKTKLFIASESAPVDVLEGMGESFDDRRDVVPGSLIYMTDEGIREEQVIEPRPSHCAFEWVYFGRPDSVMEGKSVHVARKNLGHALVETHDLRKQYGVEKGPRGDLAVIPVPDSGRSVCTGVAEGLGVPADEGIIKNAYLGRTYLIYDPSFRKTASDLKHNVIRATVGGKRVAICDDSIVRGTVSESVAKSLRKAGATEVDFLVSYAPIFNPCFSDPPDKPLAAKPYVGKSIEEIGRLVAQGLPSIDHVLYNTPENIVESIGLPGAKICTYCITGLDPFKRAEK